MHFNKLGRLMGSNPVVALKFFFPTQKAIASIATHCQDHLTHLFHVSYLVASGRQNAEMVVSKTL